MLCRLVPPCPVSVVAGGPWQLRHHKLQAFVVGGARVPESLSLELCMHLRRSMHGGMQTVLAGQSLFLVPAHLVPGWILPAAQLGVPLGMQPG